ncbi:unnamed protein product [Mytilus coruscus]|uniref:Uncharacterized protein n=1 Tax=Mytilus coruscus TaxID=42192 RepID=A0A6J8BAA9_MYTCO|nr:unnamed protein product [Mytilus coruscus]
MACQKLLGFIGMVYLQLPRVTATTISVQINLIDDNQAPLVAMLDTARTSSNQTSDPDWIPIFIACPGNKRSVYRSWLTPAPFNDPLVISPKTCEKDHKRRSIIDRWNWNADDLIDQVRVDLYKDSQVDAMFLFDGKGSTSVRWFSKERLLQSTYQDLSRTATINVFYMEGQLNLLGTLS